MSFKEYVAYRGTEFSIEWYFDNSGKSQAFSYFESMGDKQQDKLLYLIKRLGDHGEIKDITKFRHEDEQIYAFKPKPDRFLCFFFKGGKVVITNAFVKKRDKLPAKEKAKAVQCREDYEKRLKEGTYYD